MLWYLKQKNLVNVIKNNSTRLAAMTKFLTRLHSSRMHTARLLTVSPSMHCSRGGCLVLGGAWSRGRVSARRGICPGGCLPRGLPYDLSHHAFDVTCMLPLHQLRPTNSAAAYIVLVGHVTCKACLDTHPPVDRITDSCKNITFPQLRLRAGTR